MSNKQRTVNNEQLAMSNGKKTCFDCLHCKVSVKSTKNNRLLFCAESKNKENHKEPYWLAKKVCKKFEDMTA